MHRPELSLITGLRTAAYRPRVLPIAENSERVAAVTAGLASMCPMLEIDLRNSAIIDALVARGEVTLTAGPFGLIVE